MSTKEIMTLVDNQQKQIEAALPAGFNTDRVIRMARTVMATNNLIQKCTPRTVLGAIIECAQLGLEPGVTGHLVPFWDNKNKCYRAQMIPDYRGLMALARRSNKISAIYADIIREGDKYDYARGTSPFLLHVPVLGNEGAVIAAYAVATFAGTADSQFEIVARRDLDKLRDAALAKIKSDAAKKYSPWTTSESEMQKKTAVRRLCKFLPFATEDLDIQRAIILDEAAERGEQRPGAGVIDADFHVEEPDEPEQPMTDEEKAELGKKIEEARAK